MKRRNVRDLVAPWTLWSTKRPPTPGLYWLAGFWRPSSSHDSYSFGVEPEEPIVWDVDEAMINGDFDVAIIHGFPANMLLWIGPLKAPEFSAPIRPEEQP